MDATESDLDRVVKWLKDPRRSISANKLTEVEAALKLDPAFSPRPQTTHWQRVMKRASDPSVNPDAPLTHWILERAKGGSSAKVFRDLRQTPEYMQTELARAAAAERDTATTERDTARAERDTAIEGFEAALAILRVQREELLRLQTALEDAEELAAKRRTESRGLRAELKAAHSEAQELRDAQSAEASSARKEAERLEARLKKEKSRATKKLNEELAALEAQWQAHAAELESQVRELQVKLADARSAVELEKLRQQLAAEKQTGKVRLEWHAKDGSRLDKYHAMHDADAERRMNALQPSTAGASDAAGAAKMAEAMQLMKTAEEKEAAAKAKEAAAEAKEAEAEAKEAEADKKAAAVTMREAAAAAMLQEAESAVMQAADLAGVARAAATKQPTPARQQQQPTPARQQQQPTTTTSAPTMTTAASPPTTMTPAAHKPSREPLSSISNISSNESPQGPIDADGVRKLSEEQIQNLHKRKVSSKNPIPSAYLRFLAK